jgi:hypothetical protein
MERQLEEERTEEQGSEAHAEDQLQDFEAPRPVRRAEQGSEARRAMLSGGLWRGRDAGSSERANEVMERRCVWWEDSGEVGGLKRENKEVDVSGNGRQRG